MESNYWLLRSVQFTTPVFLWSRNAMGGNGASCLCYDSTLLNGAWAHEPVTYIICYVLSRNLGSYTFSNFVAYHTTAYL